MYFVLEGRTGPRFFFDTSEIMSMIAVSLRHLNIMHDRILSGQQHKKNDIEWGENYLTPSLFQKVVNLSSYFGQS